MASKKEGGKNRKFGRHARNPSSANQAKRSERNKLRRISAATKKSVGHTCPRAPSTDHLAYKQMNERLRRMVFRRSNQPQEGV